MTPKHTFRIVILLAAALVLLLTGCDPAAPAEDALTPVAVTPPTVTPGGRVVMWLPTLVPPTLTPTPPPANATPAYLLTALPVMGDGFVECPDPAVLPEPSAPSAFSQYTGAINMYLTAGGAPSELAGVLESWQAIGEDFGQVTDAYDLTGDGVYEVITTVADPYNAAISPRPGQLLVYGCHEQDYRLLFSSDYGPGLGLPEILYVGDMNADTTPELVLFQQRCQSGSCVQTAQVLTWSAPNDGFLALNVDTVGSPDGRFSIQDLDGDNVLELMIQGGGISTNMEAGPPRSSTTVWDWNGLNYIRALTQLDPPLYRIHVIHDADRALEAGDTDEAIRLYREALDNPRLGSWQVPNEPIMLRAYAHYRLLLTYAFTEQDSAALNIHTTLMAENPDTLPSYAYAAIGDAFWRTYQSAQHNMHSGCLAAAETATSYPQAAIFLNSYGPANRSYQIPDLCPF